MSAGRGGTNRFLRPKAKATPKGGGKRRGANPKTSGANRECRFLGEDEKGDMRCHSLRDNKLGEEAGKAIGASLRHTPNLDTLE